MLSRITIRREYAICKETEKHRERSYGMRSVPCQEDLGSKTPESVNTIYGQSDHDGALRPPSYMRHGDSPLTASRGRGSDFDAQNSDARGISDFGGRDRFVRSFPPKNLFRLRCARTPFFSFFFLAEQATLEFQTVVCRPV